MTLQNEVNIKNNDIGIQRNLNRTKYGELLKKSKVHNMPGVR